MGGGKGGSGGGMEPDKKYNRRMANIAEDNQAMAREMFNLFKYGVTYDPSAQTHDGSMITTYENKWNAETGRYERTQVQKPDPAGYKTMGELQGYNPDDYVSEMELMQEMLQAQSKTIPAETNLKLAQYEEGEKLVRERSGVMQSLYKQALQGVDVDRRVSENRAGIEHAFKNQQGITNRNLGRMGIDPSSGRGLSMAQNVQLEKSKALASSEATVRRDAEDENFKRLAGSAGVPI